MATSAPPAYSVDEGAPLAAYNPASAPAYNPAAAQAPPSGQPAANVTYVDQYGNPVPAPASAQPAITYVDQYGNPVNPPVQAAAPPSAQPAANVTYVDQYGNPVPAPSPQPTAQPAGNVTYVDQYGNPVNAPAQTQVQPAQTGAPNIKYVDQYGNPVAAPTQGVTTTFSAPVVNTNVTVVQQQQRGGCCGDKNRCNRTASFIMGIWGALFLFIGLISDHLAQDRLNDDFQIRYICGFTELRIKCPDYYDWSWSSSVTSCDQDQSWGDLCDTQNIAEGWGIPLGPDICATQAAAGCCLAFSVLALLFATLGFLTVPPCCGRRTFCCRGFSRVMFVLSNVGTLLSIILWFSIADFCQGENHADPSSGSFWSYEDDGFGMGATHYMNIFGGFFIFIAMCLAHAPPS